MTSEPRTLRQDAAVIASVAGAHCFSHYYIFALPTVLAFMVADPRLAHLELTFAKAGLVMSAFSLSSGGAQYLMGVLADRIGAKPVLFGGMAILAAAMALIGFADSFPLIVALAFVAGLGNSVFHPVDYAIMGASVSQRRLAKAYALHTFAGYSGFALGPLAAGLLTAHYGWRTAFIVAGVTGLALTALLWTQRARMAGERPPKPDVAPNLSGTLGLGVILSPPILFMFLFYLLSGGLSLGLNSTVPPALHNLWQVPLPDAAVAVTAFMFGAAFGTLAGGYVATFTKRLDFLTCLAYGAASTILAVIAAVAMPYALLLAAFFFAGFVSGVITPSRDMMVKSITPPGHSGKVFGFVSSGFDVGGILFPPLFGWFIDRALSEWVFYGSGVVMAGAFIAAVAATRIRRPVAAAAPAE